MLNIGNLLGHFEYSLFQNDSGECLADASDMTTSKATRSYTHWLHELSKSQSASTGALTVVLPFVTLDDIPLEGAIADDSAHLANTTDSEAETAIQPLQNVVTKVTTSLSDNNTNTTHRIADRLQANSNQTGTVTVGVGKNVTAPVRLPITDHNDVTEMPPKVDQTTASANDRNAPGHAVDFKVPEDDSEIPWLIVESLKPIPSPLKMYPDIRSRQPSRLVPYDNNPDIPWLILKSPDSTPSVPTTRPAPTPKSPSPTALVPIRRPLPTTARPTTHHWPMRHSAQTNNRLISSFIRPQRPNVPVRPQVRPTTSIDNQGIPWLILKSPDPSPSSLEMFHYPESPTTNELVSNEDNDDRSSDYFFSRT